MVAADRICSSTSQPDMKRSYVQCAELILEPGADQAAPGGAVTLALCGSWNHPGPCRWPHQTSAEWDAQAGTVRVVFVADEDDEKQVRTLIDQALAGGECTGPDGRLSRWRTTAQRAGILSESEETLAIEIAQTRGDK